VQEQIDYIQGQGLIKNGPKKVLVIGASTGYGLASRVVAAFGCQAATIGVFMEKEAENNRRTASAGWYNSVAFEQKAKEAGLYAKSLNMDAFSDEAKAAVTALIKKDLGKVDLIVYSVAAPRRQHPKTGQVAKSVLRPIGDSYTSRSLDVSTHTLGSVTLPPATDEDIKQTISVMGGEDWEYWMDALEREKLLEEGVLTVAYSYMGPEITESIYRNGTIGKAKEHLEATARLLDGRMKKIKGRALVSVNKALVTQSSSAIPVIPLYFVLLNNVMKEKGVYEDCIAQIYRLFSTRLYMGCPITVDDKGLIRMDDLEMRRDVQSQVHANWGKLNDKNLAQFADMTGYHKEFLKLFGFGMEGVDYTADVDPEQKLISTDSSCVSGMS
jgi:enoyl-[acyl-carrier protein] reductase/trans-2-enoyl-CoA reductase (NAD+)